MDFLPSESIHLVVTSPPYWTLKRYKASESQMGHITAYEEFLSELDKVWSQCFRLLVPGGRVICIVGDVCLSRKKNNGRHTVIPLHASVQEHFRGLGFDNLAPVIWYKISNAAHEAGSRTSGFLGKPYEPNAVIKNDVEFILMQRKPGGYRSTTLERRLLSLVSSKNHQRWFRQVWTDIGGASTRQHPAPYPLKLAERLVRMFSFVGDTILDPFLGSGTTTLAAARWGRNSIGVEIEAQYLDLAAKRIAAAATELPQETTVSYHGPGWATP
jgi:DNA modification methylase